LKYLREKLTSRHISYGLPPGLEDVVRKSSKVYCLTIGEDGDYFCAYKNKIGALMTGESNIISVCLGI